MKATVRIGAKDLLADVTVRLATGRLTAILGPNGAGKSTLLSLLGGQRLATEGQVLLDERPLDQHTPAALALRRALMPQESAVAFDFNAEEIVALGRFPHRVRPEAEEDGIVAAAMALTDVSHLATRVVNSLSGGEKARVHLARALAQIWHPRPDDAGRWLLLDEPTAALDIAHQHAAMQLLRKLSTAGVGVVAVLHDLNLALRYADDAVVVDAGRIVVEGSVATVLQPKLVQAIWATPCQPVMAGDGVAQLLFG